MFDDAIVRLAVRTYVLSIPLLFKEPEVTPLVYENKVHFLEGGQVTLYMRTAGTALALGAMSYNGPSVQHLFAGRLPPGLAHLPGQVDAAMRSNGAAVGQEFLWLSEVLPPAAMGNWGPYNAEGTPFRQQIIAQCRMIQQTYPAMLQMIAAQMQLAQPQIEQAIYSLVRQLNI